MVRVLRALRRGPRPRVIVKQRKRLGLLRLSAIAGDSGGLTSWSWPASRSLLIYLCMYLSHIATTVPYEPALTCRRVYVGGQQKAQGELNKATLEVAYQGVSHPTPDSFHLSLNTNVVSHTSHHPDLESFNASLFLEATEPNITSFGSITIPEVHVEAEFPVSVDQDVFITNMDQFIAYNKLVFNSDEFRLALRGKTAVKLSGLPKYNVDYNKVVTMKGKKQENWPLLLSLHCSRVEQARWL
jgi:Protein of unknown function (DUF3712)